MEPGAVILAPCTDTQNNKQYAIHRDCSIVIAPTLRICENHGLKEYTVKEKSQETWKSLQGYHNNQSPQSGRHFPPRFPKRTTPRKTNIIRALRSSMYECLFTFATKAATQKQITRFHAKTGLAKASIPIFNISPPTKRQPCFSLTF